MKSRKGRASSPSIYYLLTKCLHTHILFRDVVDVSKIMRGIKRKDDYEARIASIKAGREGREYGSKKGKEERSSLTNREKSKKTKAFMMMVHKKSVKGKAKRSLREKQKVLRAHIKKQKMKK